MKQWLLVLLSILVVGCSTFEQPFKPEFFRENPVIVPVILYDEDQMDFFCGGALPPNRKRLACAWIPLLEKEPCRIFLYHNSSKETIKHEKDHCRYGRWHD